MNHRHRAAVGRAIAVAVAIGMLAPAGAAAQAADEAVPRTAWGAPDIQGVWDFRSITPMERPDDLGDRAFLSEEEAANLEQETLARNEELLNRPARRTEVTASVDRGEEGAPGFYNNLWLDRGTAPVGTRRTSLVVDPPDGKIPALVPEAAERQAQLRAAREGVDNHSPTPGGWVEDLGANGLQLRCITGFNAGPPMTPGGYNNNVQIFQTPDHVVLLNEMNHNARVVPLDGRPEIDLPQWTGDSRGHWEGDTLVVETANFLRETSFRSGMTDDNLRLTERFTRVSQGMLMYEATIDDPTVWTRPWTYEVPMVWNEQPMYEYACHEGNYGLYNILAGGAGGGGGGRRGRGVEVVDWSWKPARNLSRRTARAPAGLL